MSDLISRQDAIDAVCEYCEYFNNEKILEKIKSLPSAERKGHWIEHHEPYTWMGYTYWTCSECACECGYEKEIPNRTNCCYNCGARMVNKNADN